MFSSVEVCPSWGLRAGPHSGLGRASCRPGARSLAGHAWESVAQEDLGGRSPGVRRPRPVPSHGTEA